MLWGIEWKHWFGAGMVVAAVVLFRLALHWIWLWRLGPKHDFDLARPETIGIGHYRSTEAAETADGVVVVPAGTRFATADGRVDYAVVEFTVLTSTGAEVAVEGTPVRERSTTRYTCRRCGKTLDGMTQREMRELHPALARGCRPS